MAWCWMLTAKWSKFRQLSGGQRQLLLQAAAILPCLHIALRVVGYPRLHRLAEELTPLRTSEKPRDSGSELQRAQEVAQIVAMAANSGLVKATCLRQSLMLWWILRTQGMPSNIRFGVRVNEGELEAHAWVEYDGIVLNDPADVRRNYRALLDVYPSTTAGL